jgi:Zn-dependent protease
MLLVTRLLTLLIAFTVHEFSHAWVADHFGDDTPRMNGRLTLNPLAHLDLFGSLLLLVGGFGWAKPVPVNPYALGRRSSAALMWVSLAGPGSNLLLAVLAAIPMRLGLVTASGFGPINGSFAATFFSEFIWINLALMIFNLIPLAPLDGEKIADYFFPPSWARVLDTIRPYGPVILILLVVSGITSFIIMPPLNTLYYLLVG